MEFENFLIDDEQTGFRRLSGTAGIKVIVFNSQKIEFARFQQKEQDC